ATTAGGAGRGAGRRRPGAAGRRARVSSGRGVSADGRRTVTVSVGAVVRWRSGTVTALGRGWPGAREVDVALHRRTGDDPHTVRALAYPALVGEPEVGDRILLNTAALALGLGTGGYALVVALPDRLPDDPARP